MIVPAVSGAFGAPLVSGYIKAWDAEKTMLIGGCVFGFALVLLGIVSGQFAGLVAFAIIVTITMFCVGFAIAAQQIAFNSLMVKYSKDKETREKNLAAIRTAAIYSIMVAAFGISCMYTLGSFIAAFMMIGGVQFCLSPLLYWRLSIAGEKWKKLQEAGIVRNSGVSQDEIKCPKISIGEIVGDKYTLLCLISLMRYHTVYFYFLVLLSPMIVTYHAVTPDKSVLAYFVAPVIYLLMLPIVRWFIKD